MKTRSLFLGVLAIASLASCSDDKVLGVSPGANGEEITYSVVTNKATRASDLYNNDNKPASFYVWAVTSDGDTYIDGDKITGSGNSYTDEGGTHYWPSSSLSFYATNYENAGLDPTSDTLSLDYTVAESVADQEDLLYAVVPEQSGGTVALNFRHALSQIVFKAENEDGNLYVRITGVGVHGVDSTGTFTFPEEATSTHQEDTYVTSGVGTWSTTGSKSADYSIDLSDVTLEGETSAVLTSGETALLLLPQTTTLTGVHHDSDESNAYLTLECAIYNIAGSEYDADTDVQLFGEEGNTATVNFPLAITWEAGKKYTYIFSFGGSDSDNRSGEDDDDQPILTSITYSVQVDEFVETEIEEDVISRRDLNGHEAVDLGLSVVWATCNVGASSETDYGRYFAWGEITEPDDDDYSSENCRLQDVTVTGDTIGGNPLYDAATANWGGTWRLPTKDEIDELINNTTQIWETKNSVYGCTVTSTINSNSIFFPIAGYYSDTDLNRYREEGYYWSCSPYGDHEAYSIFIDNSDIFDYTMGSRFNGQSVRPVSE